MRSPEQRVCQLHVVYSPGKPSSATTTLETGSLPIGREPGADVALRLDDGEVSRRHAELIGSAQAWRIEDRGSRNGTIVDGVKRAVLDLVHGAVIRIGRTLLVYTEGTAQAGEALLRETHSMRGPSLAMQRVRGRLGAVAANGRPLLLVGEAGAGKEAAARELHERSRRPGKFVVGSTDADVAAAAQGTLFVDEADRLDDAGVTRIARLVDDPGDVRVILSARVPLTRVELLGRLGDNLLEVPPLRQRREDVLWLARGFLDHEGRRLELSAGAAEALLLWDWPGNVRELGQVIAEASARASKTTILRAEHLPPEIARPVAARRSEPALDGEPDGTMTRRQSD